MREVKGLIKWGTLSEREALCVSPDEVRGWVEGARGVRVREELKAGEQDDAHRLELIEVVALFELRAE
jgi:hypothetical protein